MTKCSLCIPVISINSIKASSWGLFMRFLFDVYLQYFFQHIQQHVPFFIIHVIILLYCFNVDILELLVNISLVLSQFIVYRHMLILLLILNLKMTVGRSKHCSFLTLTFIVKSVLKHLLICTIKHPEVGICEITQPCFVLFININQGYSDI